MSVQRNLLSMLFLTVSIAAAIAIVMLGVSYLYMPTTNTTATALVTYDQPILREHGFPLPWILEMDSSGPLSTTMPERMWELQWIGFIMNFGFFISIGFVMALMLMRGGLL